MANKKSIYDFPDVYDAVLRASQKDIETEVNSIKSLLAKRGINNGRVLELACGTCAHGIHLAQNGFSVIGIDISPRMLDGAKARAKSAGVEIELFQVNVIDFNLPTELFDCAIFMAETFPLITEYSDIESHFRSVRRHLRKGGIYIIDIDTHKYGIGDKYEKWGNKRVNLNNGLVEVWHESFPGDLIHGTSRMKMHCKIHLNNKPVCETVDEWNIRVDSPWNLSVLVKTLKDWSLIGFFSWRDLGYDISRETHYFMVIE